MKKIILTATLAAVLSLAQNADKKMPATKNLALKMNGKTPKEYPGGPRCRCGCNIPVNQCGCNQSPSTDAARKCKKI